MTSLSHLFTADLGIEGEEQEKLCEKRACHHNVNLRGRPSAPGGIHLFSHLFNRLVL